MGWRRNSGTTQLGLSLLWLWERRGGKFFIPLQQFLQKIIVLLQDLHKLGRGKPGGSF